MNITPGRSEESVGNLSAKSEKVRKAMSPEEWP